MSETTPRYRQIEDYLLERIRSDPAFGLTDAELAELTDPKTFTGMSELQTEMYLRDCVRPVLEQNASSLGCEASVNV